MSRLVTSGSLQNNATTASTHRRTNSKAGNSTEQQAQPRAQVFKFPATPVLSGDSPIMGSEELKPARGPLQAVYEEKTGPPSMPNNTTKHRLSPSLPYPDLSPRSSPTRSTHSVSRSSTSSSPLSRFAAHLGRSTPQDLGFGVVFTLSFFVFILALAGVGYNPPPEKTSMPLLVPTNPHFAPDPPVYAQPEAPKRPAVQDNVPRGDIPPANVVPLRAQQEAAAAAPVVIREEEEGSENIPAVQQPDPARAQRQGDVEFDHHDNARVGVVRQHEPPAAEELESLQQRLNRLEAQQRMQIRQGIKVHEESGEELVGGSPADPLLDEDHADHSHHEDSVYDRAEDGSDEHGHSHEHPDAGIEEDEEADRVLEFHEDADDEFEVDPGQARV